jgi:ankyrin repeat protein
VKVARMLIERSADVSARDKYGSTPLHLASQGGHVKIAHMLIERGTDVSAQDGESGTGIHHYIARPDAFKSPMSLCVIEYTIFCQNKHFFGKTCVIF